MAVVARFSYYFSSPDGFRAARSELLTSVTGLPAWGRFIVLLLAIPGVVLIALSLLALMASIAALLLLTVPAYAVLWRLTQWLKGQRRDVQVPQTREPAVERPARRVETTVIGSE